MSFTDSFSDPSLPAAPPPTLRAQRRANIWHRAFSRWFDHRKAGHRIRSAIWGVITDALAITFWRPYR